MTYQSQKKQEQLNKLCKFFRLLVPLPLFVDFHQAVCFLASDLDVRCLSKMKYFDIFT